MFYRKCTNLTDVDVRNRNCIPGKGNGISKEKCECECVLMELNVLRKCGKDGRVLMSQFARREKV